MSNRNHALTNKEARALEEDELLLALSQVFEASNSRPPSAEETLVLREAARWVKENTASWREFERGLQDQTWDLARGPGGVRSEGN